MWVCKSAISKDKWLVVRNPSTGEIIAKITNQIHRQTFYFYLEEGLGPRLRPCHLYRFHMCTNLTPRPMTVVFGLGTRLCFHTCTTLENGVLRNRHNRAKLRTVLSTTVNL